MERNTGLTVLGQSQGGSTTKTSPFGAVRKE